MSTLPVTPSTSLFEFFRGHIDSAVLDTGAGVSDHGVYYLANLLVEGSVAGDPGEQTLAEMHIAGAQGDTAAAIRHYKALGDRALVTAGFFRESLRGRIVGPAYYEDMGAFAYARLATLLKGGRRLVRGGLEAIFLELAACFGGCAQVLGEVRESIAAEKNTDTDADILALYERWLDSGSPALARRLKDLGVAPLRPATRSTD